MPNYWYTVTNNFLSDGASFTSREIICGAKSIQHAHDKVKILLLKHLKSIRFYNLLQNLGGVKDLGDVEVIRAYLPENYKQYADNLDELEKQMATMDEISEMYTISNIEEAPNCYGCIYDSPIQMEHLECPNGCLHDIASCSICNN